MWPRLRPYEWSHQIGKYLYNSFPNGQTIIGHEYLKIGDDLRKNFRILFAGLFDESNQELSDVLRSILLEPDDLVQKVVQQVRVLLEKDVINGYGWRLFTAHVLPVVFVYFGFFV